MHSIYVDWGYLYLSLASCVDIATPELLCLLIESILTIIALHDNTDRNAQWQQLRLLQAFCLKLDAFALQQS